MKINGHQLPDEIITAVADGIWQLPTDIQVLEAAFPGIISFKFAVLMNEFQLENEFLALEFGPNSPAEVGWAIAEHSYCDEMLARAECMLIGMFWFHDSPIAIDFRHGRRRVSYLCASDPPKWSVAFQDVSDFVDWLRLNAGR